MDGDFDASKYDEMMQAVFDQQYYDEEDEEKPEFLDDDEEMLGEGFCLLEFTHPAKSLQSNTGGGSFCLIGIQYAMPYSEKYTPPHCFFCIFAGWASRVYYISQYFKSEVL